MTRLGVVAILVWMVGATSRAAVVLAGVVALAASSTSEKRKAETESAPREGAVASDASAAIAVDAAVPAPAPIAGAPIVVTAIDLIKDYKASESRADDKYRNRLVDVTGEVSGIGTDAFGFGKLPGAVILKTKIGDVQTNAGSAASSLKRGQTATLRCTGKGVASEPDTGFVLPLLADCTIVKR